MILASDVCLKIFADAFS